MKNQNCLNTKITLIPLMCYFKFSHMFYELKFLISDCSNFKLVMNNKYIQGSSFLFDDCKYKVESNVLQYLYFKHKMILWVGWNYGGVIHKFIMDSLTINANLYSKFLKWMNAIVQKKYLAVVNKKWALLQKDDAVLHTTTQNKLQKLQLIYSPKLAPPNQDSFLVLKMLQPPRGCGSFTEEVLHL